MNPFLRLKTMSRKIKLALFLLVGTGLVLGGAAMVKWLRTVAPLIGNWSPPLLPSLFWVGIAVILLLWKLPRWQVARSKGLTNENRFDRENEARKTLAQIVAGAFLLAGLYSSVQTFNLSREGQITDRFTKAIEQLGALDDKGQKKREVRLGGIYALERIANDSERDHVVIMEVLTTYVREHSPRKRSDLKNQETAPPGQNGRVNAQVDESLIAVDIQAILKVLGRREVKYDLEFVNLSNTDLYRANLSEANLSDANLFGANLSRADLQLADLSRADLSDSNLSGANLFGATLGGTKFNDANLNGANLSEASLIGAHFGRANLPSAHIIHADLSHADLSGSNLHEADLRRTLLIEANLSNADLSGADLSGANLSRADLSKARGLTQEQIESSRGNALTLLPAGLKTPKNWGR